MKITELSIPDLLLIEPAVFEDDRGYFMESYNEAKFAEATGIQVQWIQDNESQSNKNVLRGLHLQKEPYAQAKLVRVIRGSVLDVAVDLRSGSKTFGHHVSAVLSGENRHQLYIPEGFAHGFLVLEDHTVFAYKCSGYYHKASEVCVQWNDEAIGINWGITSPILSEKDEKFALNLSALIQ